MTSVSGDKLLPCPLPACGSENVQLIYASMGGCYIECVDCGLTTRTIQDDNDDAMNHDLALRYWNTRSSGEQDNG